MKKLSVLLLLLSMSLFTVGSIAGCGGEAADTGPAEPVETSDDGDGAPVE